MSYLGGARLHFAGRFGADVSTVNNDPRHFDNATFVPAYQRRQTERAPNGWFNPRGSSSWRFFGCRVTSAWLDADTPAPDDDPVLTYRVMDSDRDAPAKLVDLDPEQQLVSMIFGLAVRITSDDGAETVLRSHFRPAAFTDIWSRKARGGSDIAACATYQSVLDELEWGDVSASPALEALRRSAPDGTLSIKFMVDGFDMTPSSANFMTGRIVGTIGPASADEPQHLVAGRHFLTTSLPTNSFFDPVGRLNFCVARVDEDAGRLYLDLGNALPTTADNSLDNLGDITLTVVRPEGEHVALGVLPADVYTAADWYDRSAGIVVFPARGRLPVEHLRLIAEHPLTIGIDAGQGPVVAIAESPGGLYVRADQFVFRLDAGTSQQVELVATKYGHPHAHAGVTLVLDPNQLQPDSQLGTAPPVGVPTSAVTFPDQIQTDAAGRAAVTVTVTDPGNPRDYIDGQVYGLRPMLTETIATQYPFDPADFVSLLVHDAFEPATPVTWHGAIHEILQQYANLYPVMDDFLDLGDYEAVCRYRGELSFVFDLPLDDPNSMPVTRDLSNAKRKAIIAWLTTKSPEELPPLGDPPPAEHTLATAPAPEADGGTARSEAERGGKAAALARRPGLAPAVAVGTTMGELR